MNLKQPQRLIAMQLCSNCATEMLKSTDRTQEQHSFNKNNKLKNFKQLPDNLLRLT